MNKFLRIYGERAGTFCPSNIKKSQISVFKAVELTEDQRDEFIQADNAKKQQLLEKYRAENPQLSGQVVEKKNVVRVQEKESENKIVDKIELIEDKITERIDEVEDAIEAVGKKIENVITTKKRGKK